MILSRLTFLALAVIPAAIAQAPDLGPEPVPPILATSGDECAEYFRLASDYQRRAEEASSACHASAREAGKRGGYTPAFAADAPCCLEYSHGAPGGSVCRPLAVCAEQFDRGYCFAVKAERKSAECWERVRAYQGILHAVRRSHEESKNQQAMNRVTETAGQGADILLEPRNQVASAVTKASLDAVGAVAGNALDQLDTAMLSAGMAPGTPPEWTPDETAVSEAASLLLQMKGEWSMNFPAGQVRSTISADRLLEESTGWVSNGWWRQSNEYLLEYLGNRIFKRVQISDLYSTSWGQRNETAVTSANYYYKETLELADDGDIIVRIQEFTNFPEYVYRWPKGGGTPVLVECDKCR